jgi:Glutathione S-transferase, C-terminal domain
VALGFRRLIEESLYWATVYTRWFEPAGWVVLKAAFFADLPTPEVVCADACARHFETENAWPQHGRHSREDIYAIGCADLSALAVFLAEKPLFLGEKPTSLDTTGYAFLANLLWAPVASPLKRHML